MSWRPDTWRLVYGVLFQLQISVLSITQNQQSNKNVKNIIQFI